MSILLFANNATTTLAGAISSSATAVNFAAGTGALFPSPGAGQYYVLTFVSASDSLITEFVWVTAMSGDTATIVRGQEGSTAKSWSVGDFASLYITAGTAGAFLQLTQAELLFAAINGSSSEAFVVSNLTAATGVFGNNQVFTSSGIFTVPAGVTKIKARVWGGGGGGSGSANSNNGYAGAGGGGSGYSEGPITVTPGQVITATVGAAGTGGAATTAGTTGGSSAFDVINVNGGGGGLYQNTGGSLIQTNGGSGSGGTLNLTGGVGYFPIPFGSGSATMGGPGGAAAMGGPGGGWSIGTASVGQFPGGGGGGAGGNGGATGGNGGGGLIIVEW